MRQCAGQGLYPLKILTLPVTTSPAPPPAATQPRSKHSMFSLHVLNRYNLFSSGTLYNFIPIWFTTVVDGTELDPIYPIQLK